MITKKEIEDFALYVSNHKCMPEIYTRIKQNIFESFVVGTDDERAKAGDLMFAVDLVMGEIQAISSDVEFDKEAEEGKEAEEIVILN